MKLPTPITPELERELVDAGAMDSAGYILRPKIRAAFDRIADGAVPLRVSDWQAYCNAERFVLSIHRTAKRAGETFDQTAERLGY